MMRHSLFTSNRCLYSGASVFGESCACAVIDRAIRPATGIFRSMAVRFSVKQTGLLAEGAACHVTESYLSHRTMRKIAIVGPESSGKTTLCEALAEHYKEPWTREHARSFLNGLARPYEEDDLLAIALGQCGAEEDAARGVDRFLFCDTDMITVRIWSEEKFGRCHPTIIELSEARTYHHWLLCRPDIPWEPDPLRENPHDRDRLFDVYAETLYRLRKPFSVMVGDQDRRLRMATTLIDAQLGRDPELR